MRRVGPVPREARAPPPPGREPNTGARGPPKDSSGRPGAVAIPSHGSLRTLAAQQRPQGGGEMHSFGPPTPPITAAPLHRALPRAGRGSDRVVSGCSRSRRFWGPLTQAQGGQQ
ncbi:hypothetical protein NDU88_005972 [Pleurodeles waltl]|uniref:Uncharacterized protein n=1 Tax=Pleurodeles waltl TaxID=8319 RepID=A0AAV7QML5_PLEWA|nr:hypothetical protein NDU88_005972 [Pleurodeles waltl]